MLNGSKALVVATLLSVGAGCSPGRYSSAGFRLPADGNPERGKQAFVQLGCHSCHEVSGSDLPKPSVQPPVPVALGGEVVQRLSDAYLVTSMINPSYELAPYPKEQITSGGVSRMPNYADKMSVRQMVDVVAFLQSKYVVRQMPDNGIR
jgi:L-cysteine S-thiosulfotransferase